MMEGAGGGGYRCFGWWGGFTLRDDGPVDAGALRGADDGAEVSRVLDLVQSEKKSWGFGVLKQFVKVGPLESDEFGQNTLSTDAIAGLAVDRDSALAGEGYDLALASVQRTFGDDDFADALRCGPQCFAYRVDAADGVHYVHDDVTVTTAWTAMPSALPVNPIPSVVVALSPTASSGMPRISESLVLMDGR